LSHRNLFILPSKFGWVFLAAAIVLLILGNNYQNNLIMALGLWLLSLMCICLLLCYQNLSGLTLVYSAAPEGFCDTWLEVKLAVEGALASKGRSTSKDQSSSKGVSLEASLMDWVGEQSSRYVDATLVVGFKSVRRGVHTLPRIQVQSRYPLGLFRCWTLVDVGGVAIVYPRALAGYVCPLVTLGGAAQSAQQHGTLGLSHEFVGLKAYQAGESLSRIAWKQVAAGRGWHQKQFAEEGGGALMLAEHALEAYPAEQRFEILTYWLLELGGLQPVGLTLYGSVLAPRLGSEHLKVALGRLARAPHGAEHA
jgi:uncharacterized protein (DUF58 family)